MTLIIVIVAALWLLIAWVVARLLYKPLPTRKEDFRNLMVAGGLALAWPFVVVVFVVAFICMGFAWLAGAGKAPTSWK